MELGVVQLTIEAHVWELIARSSVPFISHQCFLTPDGVQEETASFVEHRSKFVAETGRN